MEKYTDMYSDIFKVIYTNEQARQFSADIEQLTASMYKINSQSIHELTSGFEENVRKALLGNIEKNKLDCSDFGALKKYFSGLSECINKLQVADLTLSIEPDWQLVQDICNFLRDSLNENRLVVNIHIDSKIISGIQLVWKGQYLNFTLERSLDEWFGNKENISNMGTLT